MQIEDIIINKVDIVDYVSRYVELKQYGGTWRGTCPIHEGKTESSFAIFPNNTYFCFSCSSFGNIINFVADIEHITYPEAIEKLALELNIDIGHDEEYQNAKTLIANNDRIIKEAKQRVGNVEAYLQGRGLSEKTINEFDLGFHNGALLIPIRNCNGQSVALAKRQFDKVPKYMNSHNSIVYDKSSILYNMDKARRLIKDKVYLVEGYMDAISGHQMGIPTVAFCSNELHKDQIKELARMLKRDTTVIYVPDNDEAGVKRLPRVREHFHDIAPHLQVRVAVIPDGIKDMNDMLKDGLDPLLLETMHIDKFVMRYIVTHCSTQEEEYAKAEQFVRTIHSAMIKLDIIKMLAERWGQDIEELKKYFNTCTEDINDILDEASDANDCLNDLRRLYARGIFKTHYAQIDNCIGGMTKKQVVIIGAYSNAGKTGFATELLLRQITQNKSRVAFFSLEMPKGKIMELILAKLIGCQTREIAGLLVSDGNMIAKVISQLEKRLVIFDKNNLSMSDIEDRVKALNAKNTLGGPIDMVIVDYFTYLKGANTYDGASEAALRMKGFAKENNLIFVMLSQLNRSGGNYEEPTMNLLRMTGDLEASGDIIIMLWRPDRAPNLTLEQQQSLHNITRAKIEKSRDGIFGADRLQFKYNGATSRLEEMLEVAT